jgi:hypothetical protein
MDEFTKELYAYLRKCMPEQFVPVFVDTTIANIYNEFGPVDFHSDVKYDGNVRAYHLGGLVNPTGNHEVTAYEFQRPCWRDVVALFAV